jgi:hypothetical protein
MPPQTTCSLEYEINRRKISYDQVKIQIQTLFCDLGSDEDFSA